MAVGQIAIGVPSAGGTRQVPALQFGALRRQPLAAPFAEKSWLACVDGVRLGRAEAMVWMGDARDYALWRDDDDGGT